MEGVAKPGNAKDGTQATTIAIAISVPILVLLLMAVVIYGVYQRRLNSGTKPAPVIRRISNDNHWIFPKEGNLLETLESAAIDKEGLKEQFRDMEKNVNDNINEKTTVAKTEVNEQHNRYADISPFDNNVVTLQKPAGNTKTSHFKNN